MGLLVERATIFLGAFAYSLLAGWIKKHRTRLPNNFIPGANTATTTGATLAVAHLIPSLGLGGADAVIAAVGAIAATAAHMAIKIHKRRRKPK